MKPSQQRAIVVSLVQEQLDRERKMWMNRCISAITASVAVDLIQEWNWTSEEIGKLLTKTNSNFEHMLEKFVTVDDFYEWLKEKNIIIGGEIK